MNTIRRLMIGEGDLYRKVRLESLCESPEAFSSKYEDALSRNEESWNIQADSSAAGSDRATYIVLDDQPCGLGAIYRDGNQSEVGELIQMWVSPDYRGSSVSRDLLDRLFDWASLNGFTRIKAEVQKDNSRAIRFYHRYGFISSDEEASHLDSSIMLTKPVEQGSAHQSTTR